MDYTREEALDVLTTAYSSCGEVLRALNEVNRDCDREGVAMLDPEPLRCSLMSLGRCIEFLKDGASIDDVAEDVYTALQSYNVFMVEFFLWKMLAEDEDE